MLNTAGEGAVWPRAWVFLLAGCLLAFCRPAAASDKGGTATNRNWQTKASLHFVVHYEDSPEFATEVNEYIEGIYAGLRQRLNFTKSTDLWLYQRRVKIYIYRSQQEMVVENNLPHWALGCADYVGRKIIMTMAGDSLKGTVTHELGHQVFFDAMGQWSAPSWISEGVAGWLEPDFSKEDTRSQCAVWRDADQLLPLKQLVETRPTLLPGDQVPIFYQQSASIVCHLIQANGIDIFRSFCAQIRSGKSVNEALVLYYSSKFRGLAGLEAAWKASL